MDRYNLNVHVKRRHEDGQLLLPADNIHPPSLIQMPHTMQESNVRARQPQVVWQQLPMATRQTPAQPQQAMQAMDSDHQSKQ